MNNLMTAEVSEWIKKINARKKDEEVYEKVTNFVKLGESIMNLLDRLYKLYLLCYNIDN